MLHRVVLGAIERFMGVLIEHFAGAFPVWLAPVQARVLTVTDAHNAFAEEAVAALKARGIRAEADTRNEKLGYKVREAQLACLRRDFDTLEQEEHLKAVARKYDGQFRIWVLDAHGQDVFHVKHHIVGTPTYVMFENGVEKDRTFGKLSSQALAEFVSRTID